MSNVLKQALEDWARAGLTELPPCESQIDWSQLASQTDDAAPVSSDASQEAASATRAAQMPAARSGRPESTPAPIDSPSAVEAQQSTAEAIPTAAGMAASAKLALLQERVRTCTKCVELAASRTQTVFGVGNPNAEILFVGEAPGADEDEKGEPFVGKAGQLLDRIIAACGWNRQELYICNVLRCRPPGNRNPTDQEAANCREYLDGQIAAVAPKWIVCWGSVAARNLLGVDQPIGRMRKRLFDHNGAKVLCTYHPSYLLRYEPAKKEVWTDLQFLFKEMGYTPPTKRS